MSKSESSPLLSRPVTRSSSAVSTSYTAITARINAATSALSTTYSRISDEEKEAVSQFIVARETVAEPYSTGGATGIGLRALRDIAGPRCQTKLCFRSKSGEAICQYVGELQDVSGLSNQEKDQLLSDNIYTGQYSKTIFINAGATAHLRGIGHYANRASEGESHNARLASHDGKLWSHTYTSYTSTMYCL